jgi:hypothetical protein
MKTEFADVDFVVDELVTEPAPRFCRFKGITMTNEA